MNKSLYLIGSLRQPEKVQAVAAEFRGRGWDVFDDWLAAGPEADDYWQKYSKNKGQAVKEALKDHAAQHVFKYDKSHLDRCSFALLVLPAGKSGHLELGYFLGRGKPGYILLDGEPERYDVMYNFADAVFVSTQEALDCLEKQWTGERAAGLVRLKAMDWLVKVGYARYKLNPGDNVLTPYGYITLTADDLKGRQ